jgi:hypothetical protein
VSVLSTQYSVLSTKYLNLIIALALVIGAPSISSAQALLRWNLKPGQSFGLHSHQETDSEVGFSGKSAKTTIKNDLFLTWKVTTTDDEVTTIRQSIDRIVVNIVTRDAAAIEYDSAATGRPMGQAASLASGLKRLLGAELQRIGNTGGPNATGNDVST